MRQIPSPPAREVWVEILQISFNIGSLACRLPRGRCGLKCTSYAYPPFSKMSPPAREVWVEIVRVVCGDYTVFVSPPAREVWVEIISAPLIIPAGVRRLPRGRCGLKSLMSNPTPVCRRRLPRGRCGLKSRYSIGNLLIPSSPPAREVWVEIPI